MALPATIKQGSTGSAVKQWQGIISVEADGIFGPKTKLATQDWQRQHKLNPDGVVGPATWGVALEGKEPLAEVPKQAQTPSLDTDRWALDVAKRAAPQLTEAERQYALTVARGEGFYGLGWKGEGKGSNNWGAVQGTGSAGSFTNIDHHADGKAYQGKFKRYRTPEEGFSDMARVLYSGGKRGASGADEIRGALKRGSLKDAVNAQHNNGYFELAPDKYLAAVARNYGILSANLKWPTALSISGKSIMGVSSAVAGGILALVASIGAFLWWKAKG